MSKTVKIVLIVVVALLVTMGACVGGVVWFASTKADELVAMGEKAKEDAETFAATTDQRGCLDETVARNAACAGIMCETQVTIFLTLCLDAAAPTEGFCEGVPPEMQIMKSVNWRLETCAAQMPQLEGQRCSRMLGGWQKHCHPI